MLRHVKSGTFATATCLCCLLTPYAAQAQAPITELILHSQPGDFIGQGQDYVYTSADGTFQANAEPFLAPGQGIGTGPATYASFFFSGNSPGIFSSLDFATNALPGTPLGPGVYTDAQRAAFAELGHPGLDVSLNGRGSNTLTGSFTISDAQFGPSDVSGEYSVTSFAATFEQHSEGATPALFGTLYYNYAPPAAVPEASTFIGFSAGAVVLVLAGFRSRRRSPAPA